MGTTSGSSRRGALYSSVFSPATSVIKSVLKTAFQKDRSLRQIESGDFPTDFFPVQEKRYLYQRNETYQKQIIPARYDFMDFHPDNNRQDAVDICYRDRVSF